MNLGRMLFHWALVLAVSAPAIADDSASADSASEDMETLELTLQDVERDLALLEEDLLYPPSSRVAVYLDMDVGELFQLDAVKVELNGKEVAHHLYTESQINALYRGAVQQLFVGNVDTGENEVSAFFIGIGPNGREYKRATSLRFEKAFDPLFVELTVADSDAMRQPEFRAQVH